MVGVAGFEWDEGNRPHCLKHGVSTAEIEAVFQRPVTILPDQGHSQLETRLLAVSTTGQGRAILLVFTVRERNGERLIRPISARYMHAREVQRYEEDNPQL